MVHSDSASPLSIQTLRAVAGRVLPRYQVARADLFGSMAKGDTRFDSDVDLLIEFLPEADAGLFQLGALKEDLEEQLGCRVDLLSRRAVEASRNRARKHAILQHLVAIYAP